MAVPDYQSVMLPLLEYAANRNGELSTGEAADALAVSLGLSEEDLNQMLPSGISPTFINRGFIGVRPWIITFVHGAAVVPPAASMMHLPDCQPSGGATGCPLGQPK